MVTRMAMLLQTITATATVQAITTTLRQTSQTALHQIAAVRQARAPSLVRTAETLRHAQLAVSRTVVATAQLQVADNTTFSATTLRRWQYQIAKRYNFMVELPIFR